MDADLARQLANPVANLISVPFQNNFDFGGGIRKNGTQYLLNAQPVIPFALSDKWNLITRTIVPVVQLNNVLPQNVGGLSDIVQSFFLSPSEQISGFNFGVGPVFLYPTGTDNRISANQWAAGPTAAVLRQTGPWTVGILVNHLWGFGAIGHNGQDGGAVIGLEGFPVAQRTRSARVNATYMQPFLSYTFPTRTTVGISSESTYDWTGRQWVVPLVASASQLLRVGPQIVSLGVGFKYTAVQPVGAPDWGVRFTVTLLFPK